MKKLFTLLFTLSSFLAFSQIDEVNLNGDWKKYQITDQKYLAEKSAELNELYKKSGFSYIEQGDDIVFIFNTELRTRKHDDINSTKILLDVSQLGYSNIMDVAWSNDGEKIAFSAINSSKTQIVYFNLRLNTFSIVADFTNNIKITDISFSPDDTALVYHHKIPITIQNQIFMTTNLEGTPNTKVLKSSGPFNSQFSGVDFEPFSSSRIAYSSQIVSFAGQGQPSINVINGPSNEETWATITQQGSTFEYLTWANPDRLYFSIKGTGNNVIKEYYKLDRVNDQSQFSLLFELNPDLSFDDNPSFSPDENKSYFSIRQSISTGQSNFILFLAEFDSNGISTQFTDMGAGRNADWRRNIPVFPDPLTGQIVVLSNVNCNGESNGSAEVIPSGGDGNYNVVWDNGEQGLIATMLDAGIHRFILTDGSGLSVTGEIEILEPSPIDIVFNGFQSTCNDNTGILEASIGGGVGGYSFLWSNGSTNDRITGLEAGVYTITVIDANSCEATKSVEIDDVGGFEAQVALVSNVSCFGESDGAARINITAGNESGPFRFTWSNGETNQAISGLSAGFYEVTATSEIGCVLIGEITITEPPEIQISETNIQPATCGESNGSISVNVSGGTPGYTQVWNTGQTGSQLNQISAGTYTITVTDADNCVKSQSFVVQDEGGLNVTIAIDNPISCFGGNNGRLTASTTGSGNISFRWSNNATTRSISNLTAGTYFVTATDQTGCNAVSQIELIQPSELQINAANIQSASCGQNNGAISVDISGGTPGYSSSWNTGQSGNQLNQISAGTYTITARDANNCSATRSFTVQDEGGLNVTASVLSSISCFGSNDGQLTATTSGSGNATFRWSNNASTQSISNLSAGTYFVTATDPSGCSSVDQIELNQPEQLRLIESEIEPASCGLNNGQAEIIIGGGVGNYSFNWDNGSSSNIASNLSGGSHKVTVSDGNNCTEIFDIIVPQQGTLQADILSITNVSCNGDNNGNALVQGIGNNISYSWSNGNNTNFASNLTAGTYFVTVSDNSGCSETLEINITEPPVLGLSFDILTALRCHGDSDGIIRARPIGGTPGYSFQWSNGQTTDIISGLEASVYSLVLRDENNCSHIEQTELTQPEELVLTAAVSNITSSTPTGSMIVNLTGGTSPFDFQWSVAGIQNTNFAQNLSAGTYTVTVTDANDCIAVISATIDNLSSTENLTLPFHINVFPNPNDGQFFIEYASEKFDDVLIEVFGLNGQLILKDTYFNVRKKNISIETSNSSNSIFLVHVTNSEYKIIEKIFVNK